MLTPFGNRQDCSHSRSLRGAIQLLCLTHGKSVAWMGKERAAAGLTNMWSCQCMPSAYCMGVPVLLRIREKLVHNGVNVAFWG